MYRTQVRGLLMQKQRQLSEIVLVAGLSRVRYKINNRLPNKTVLTIPNANICFRNIKVATKFDSFL